MDTIVDEYERLLGQAAIAVWADLPSDSQELLFESAATGNAEFRRRLAVFLHERHPHTIHPSKPETVR